MHISMLFTTLEWLLCTSAKPINAIFSRMYVTCACNASADPFLSCSADKRDHPCNVAKPKSAQNTYFGMYVPAMRPYRPFCLAPRARRDTPCNGAKPTLCANIPFRECIRVHACSINGPDPFLPLSAVRRDQIVQRSEVKEAAANCSRNKVRPF